MSEIINSKLYNEIKTFSETYGLIEMINENKKSFNSDKISNFVLFINDFIEKFTVNELNLNLSLKSNKRNIIKIITILSEYIRIGDNLLDSFYIERTYENYKKFLKNLATLAISSWNIQRYFKNLPINGNKLVLKALLNIKEVAEMESELKENPKKISEKEFINFTEKKNSDFFLYYSFLSPFVKPEVNEIIVEFLKNYVILDNLLDDMTDLYPDYKNNNFNYLLLELNVRNSTSEQKDYKKLISDVIENNIYDVIFRLFKKYYELANSILTNNDSKYFTYLKFILNGCFEGFNLYIKNNYYTDFLNENSVKHREICNLLFKPYPWTIISYNEIFNKIK